MAIIETNPHHSLVNNWLLYLFVEVTDIAVQHIFPTTPQQAPRPRFREERGGKPHVVEKINDQPKEKKKMRIKWDDANFKPH